MKYSPFSNKSPAKVIRSRGQPVTQYNLSSLSYRDKITPSAASYLANVSMSTLNPNATEFVPSALITPVRLNPVVNSFIPSLNHSDTVSFSTILTCTSENISSAPNVNNKVFLPLRSADSVFKYPYDENVFNICLILTAFIIKSLVFFDEHELYATPKGHIKNIKLIPTISL